MIKLPFEMVDEEQSEHQCVKLADLRSHKWRIALALTHPAVAQNASAPRCTPQSVSCQQFVFVLVTLLPAASCLVTDLVSQPTLSSCRSTTAGPGSSVPMTHVPSGPRWKPTAQSTCWI